jgi:3-isopropylmalate/(R)-2-methylmalate dehydratase small subunit
MPAPFTPFDSTLVALPRPNIDTDQLTPARFLKSSRGEGGYGEILLHDWRFDASGAERADCVLNDPARSSARILVAGDNFGCGSSRETAVWALAEYGFRVVVSTAFGDIFHTNCLKNGLLPVRVSEEDLERLVALAEDPEARVRVDLEAGVLRLPGGDPASGEIPIPIDPFPRECLLRGLDQMGYLLERDEEISAYEAARPLPEIDLAAAGGAGAAAARDP